MTRHDSQDERPSDGGRVFRLLAAADDVTPWQQVADVAPALGEYIEQGLGLLLGGPGLDLRTRELVTVSVLAALGGCDPQLTFHTAGALRSGATAEEVIEAVVQVSLYAGIPRTLNALAVVGPALHTAPAAS
jgi:4-carboxymuconolactone decarboxylase